MTLSSAECSMAVMAAFLLSLVVTLSSDPFSINIDILGFTQNCSYTVLALSFRGISDMPRTKLSSAMSQDYLDFYYTSSAIPLLGSGLGPQCKNGSGPHNEKIKFFFLFSSKYLSFWIYSKTTSFVTVKKSKKMVEKKKLT